MGCHAAALVAARAASALQTCTARSACSIIGRVLRWRSKADAATLRAFAGGSFGPWRRQRKGRSRLRWEPHWTELSGRCGGIRARVGTGLQRPAGLWITRTPARRRGAQISAHPLAFAATPPHASAARLAKLQLVAAVVHPPPSVGRSTDSTHRRSSRCCGRTPLPGPVGHTIVLIDTRPCCDIARREKQCSIARPLHALLASDDACLFVGKCCIRQPPAHRGALSHHVCVCAIACRAMYLSGVVW